MTRRADGAVQVLGYLDGLIRSARRPPSARERVLETTLALVDRQRELGAGAGEPPPADWRAWLRATFPQATASPFGARHVGLWEWFAGLRPLERSRPRQEIWPRGGGKSATAELGTTYVGGRLTRRFALYVCGTQDQANTHVSNVGSSMLAAGFGRAIGRFGHPLGWRLDMLRADNGFNVVALGLDAAARGIKLEDYRPDLIILDDIDSRHDGRRVVNRKLRTLTDTIIPTGARHVALLFIQNLVHADSVATRLLEGRAEMLLDRQVTLEPAVRNLKFRRVRQGDGTMRYRIVGGRATWPGQDLATCTQQMNDWGRPAFLREAQHELAEEEGGLWNRERDIDPFRLPTRPATLDRIVVAVDPNAGGENEAGVVVVGAARVGDLSHGYLLADETVAGGALDWSRVAVEAYRTWEGDALVAEKNNGGDMVSATFRTVRGAPPITLVHAARGKQARAEPVQKLAAEGRLHHCGVFPELEGELCRWRPGDPSPNRLDAYVWGMTDLLLGPKRHAPWFPGQTGAPAAPAPEEDAPIAPPPPPKRRGRGRT